MSRIKQLQIAGVVVALISFAGATIYFARQKREPDDLQFAAIKWVVEINAYMTAAAPRCGVDYSNLQTAFKNAGKQFKLSADQTKIIDDTLLSAVHLGGEISAMSDDQLPQNFCDDVRKIIAQAPDAISVIE